MAAAQQSNMATCSSHDDMVKILHELIVTHGWQQVYKSLMEHPAATPQAPAAAGIPPDASGTARGGGSGGSGVGVASGQQLAGVEDGSGPAAAAAAAAAGPSCPTPGDDGARATDGGGAGTSAGAASSPHGLAAGTPAQHENRNDAGGQIGRSPSTPSRPRLSQESSARASEQAGAGEHLDGPELALKILGNAKLFKCGDCAAVEGVTVHVPGYALSGLSGQKRPDAPSSEQVQAFFQQNKRHRANDLPTKGADENAQLEKYLSSWADGQPSDSGDCASTPYMRLKGAHQYLQMASKQITNCLNISIGGCLLDLEGQLRALLESKNLLQQPCSLTSLINGYNKYTRQEGNDGEAEPNDNRSPAAMDGSFLHNETRLSDEEATVIKDWLQMPENLRGALLKNLGRGKLSQCLKLAKCAEALPLLHMSGLPPSTLYKECVKVVNEYVKAFSLILTADDFTAGVPQQIKKATVEFSKMLLLAADPCLPPSLFEFTSSWVVNDGDGITIMTEDDNGTVCRYKIRLVNIDSLEFYQAWLIASKLLKAAKHAGVQVRVRYCFYQTRRRYKSCEVNTGNVSGASNMPDSATVKTEEGRYICSIEMRPAPPTAAAVSGSNGAPAVVVHEMSEWLLALGATQVSPLFLLAEDEEQLLRLFRLQGRAVEAGRKALVDAIPRGGAGEETASAVIHNVTLDDNAIKADFYRCRDNWNRGMDLISKVIPSNDDGGATYRAAMEGWIDGNMPVAGAASTAASHSAALPSPSAPAATPQPSGGFNIWSSLLYNHKDGGMYPKALFMERSPPQEPNTQCENNDGAAAPPLLIRNPWWKNDDGSLRELADNGMHMGMPWHAKAKVNDPSWTGRSYR